MRPESARSLRNAITGADHWSLYCLCAFAALDMQAASSAIACWLILRCQHAGCDSEGALYVFPQLHLPDAAHQAAKEQGCQGDFLYAKELLENTGIVAIPGSGFKQAPDTYHLRITILAPEEHLDDLIQKLGDFHNQFMSKYRS